LPTSAEAPPKWKPALPGSPTGQQHGLLEVIADSHLAAGARRAIGGFAGRAGAVPAASADAAASGLSRESGIVSASLGARG
jgi:hypothetical protein